MAQGACLLEEFLSAPTLKSSFKRHAPSFAPRPNPTSQMSFMKSRLALVLLFLTTLFATVFRSQKWGKLNVNVRWLNSDEGLRLVEEQEALWVAEEQRKCEAREQ
jgi:hypothetical protein